MSFDVYLYSDQDQEAIRIGDILIYNKMMNMIIHQDLNLDEYSYYDICQYYKLKKWMKAHPDSQGVESNNISILTKIKHYHIVFSLLTDFFDIQVGKTFQEVFPFLQNEQSTEKQHMKSTMDNEHSFYAEQLHVISSLKIPGKFLSFERDSLTNVVHIFVVTNQLNDPAKNDKESFKVQLTRKNLNLFNECITSTVLKFNGRYDQEFLVVIGVYIFQCLSLKKWPSSVIYTLYAWPDDVVVWFKDQLKSMNMLSINKKYAMMDVKYNIEFNELQFTIYSENLEHKTITLSKHDMLEFRQFLNSMLDNVQDE